MAICLNIEARFVLNPPKKIYFDIHSFYDLVHKYFY